MAEMAEIETQLEDSNPELLEPTEILDKYSQRDFIDPPKLSKVSTLNIDCLTLQ